MLEDGDRGVIIQRDKQTYAVAPHLPCGVVSPEILRKIAGVAEKFGAAALKITSAQRIAIVGLKEEDIDAVWAELGMDPGAAVGLCVRSVKACPGTTFCKRGVQDSLSVGMQLADRYHGRAMPGKMKLGVSGCPNQCAETCIKDVALVGKPKGWTVLVGGNGGGRARLSQKLTEDLSTEEALELVDRIVEFYRANAKPRERVGKMIDRIGLDALRSGVVSQ
ncbi:MAG: NAD(P)/FAD-dependent oxidoreductase [Phycisphaerae bacterium]|nr:NAD(P)/FAD-dependent oxidoreductase [Phycisphaerae bacterium]